MIADLLLKSMMVYLKSNNNFLKYEKNKIL